MNSEKKSSLTKKDERKKESESKNNRPLSPTSEARLLSQRDKQQRFATVKTEKMRPISPAVSSAKDRKMSLSINNSDEPPAAVRPLSPFQRFGRSMARIDKDKAVRSRSSDKKDKKDKKESKKDIKKDEKKDIKEKRKPMKMVSSSSFEAEMKSMGHKKSMSMQDPAAMSLEASKMALYAQLEQIELSVATQSLDIPNLMVTVYEVPPEHPVNWKEFEFEYTLSFLDQSDDFCLCLRDSDVLEQHWETILKTYFNSLNPKNSSAKPPKQKTNFERKMLSQLITQFMRAGGESKSKIQLIKWIANEHLKGKRKNMLNQLCDTREFELRVLDTGDRKQPIKEKSPAATLEQQFSSSPKKIAPASFTNLVHGFGHRKTASGNVPLNLSASGNMQMSSSPDKVPSPMQYYSPTKTSDNNSISGNSHRRRTPTMESIPASQYDLDVAMQRLIAEERLEEALQCQEYLELETNLFTTQSEYAVAKDEDRLEDALALRNAITEIKQQMDKYGTDDLTRWISEIPPSGHLTFEQMKQALVQFELPSARIFVQEFEENSIQSVAKVNLNEALELQKKIQDRFAELGAEKLREKKRKEEEERWRKEKELRKQTRKDRRDTIDEISKTVLSYESPSPINIGE